jgi:hypothetical protein
VELGVAAVAGNREEDNDHGRRRESWPWRGAPPGAHHAWVARDVWVKPHPQSVGVTSRVGEAPPRSSCFVRARRGSHGHRWEVADGQGEWRAGETVARAGRRRPREEETNGNRPLGAWPIAPRNGCRREDLSAHPNLGALVGALLDTMFWPEYPYLAMWA